MQGAQKLRSEAHFWVRRNDEVEAQHRRWTFYETITFGEKTGELAMAISKEDVIRAVAAKAGPGITLEAKLEKGIWRIILTKEGKTASLEFKRGFLDDYFDKGEYQQEIAFETRINKALKELK